MTELQQQARALGDPTRHRIFTFVADAEAPVDVAQLTAQFGLNHNAIRQHLAKLVGAGLVVESKHASGAPGRPKLVYAVEPTAESRWGVVGPYQRLSKLLAEMVRTGDTPEEVGRREGARLRAEGAAAPGLPALEGAMVREGFHPETQQRGGRVDVVLQNCPFEATALDDPDTVCALHLGIAKGLTEGADGLTVQKLVAKDPRRAGCRLQLRTGGGAQPDS
ncbi:MAG: helix-turn-helix transcriptional regulator [Acidimicrobiia bacterium]|jgi:predicted ArsR family transcriptional regulator